MRKALRNAGLALVPMLVSGLTLAAEAEKTADEKLRGLGLAGGQVGTPGFGRVLIVFLLVAALAFGATWLLRRYGFTFRQSALGVGAGIRHLARQTLPGGVACHLVETQGKHVLITISRGGVSSVLLGEAPSSAPSPGSTT